MSVDVEEWFHSENVKKCIARDQWDSINTSVERNTMRILDILDGSDSHATFFFLGWVAAHCPRLVRAVVERGHEVASHGWAHELVYSLTPSAFRTDVVRAKAVLEDLAGRPVLGYRAPCFSITDWAIPILAEAGYTYDSSMVPTVAHDRYGRIVNVDGTHPILTLAEGFDEVCVSCLRFRGRGVPWGGGGYFRLLPYPVWRWGMKAIIASANPYIFYIHPWEMDPGQPTPAAVPLFYRWRQRVGLGTCEKRFAALASDFSWTTIGDAISAWTTYRKAAT
jgi:polysaccharide deacetylase family protein (PEP-CTERM system associated)